MLSSGSDSVSPVHTHLELRETVICGNRVFASVLTEAGILGKGGPTCKKWCLDKMAAVQNHTRQGDMKVRMGVKVKVTGMVAVPEGGRGNYPSELQVPLIP